MTGTNTRSLATLLALLWFQLRSMVLVALHAVRVLLSRPRAPTASCEFYEGRVFHVRRKPLEHRFEYAVRYCLVDLDSTEPPPACCASQLADRLTADAARRLTGCAGRVKLLLLPASAGYAQNPICVYYCYAAAPAGVPAEEAPLQCCIADVDNTPWGDRATFAFAPGGDVVPKPMHVSPLQDMRSAWSLRASDPGVSLEVHVSCQHPELGHFFDASLRATRLPPAQRAAASARSERWAWLVPHQAACIPVTLPLRYRYVTVTLPLHYRYIYPPGGVLDLLARAAAAVARAALPLAPEECLARRPRRLQGDGGRAGGAGGALRLPGGSGRRAAKRRVPVHVARRDRLPVGWLNARRGAVPRFKKALASACESSCPLRVATTGCPVRRMPPSHPLWQACGQCASLATSPMAGAVDDFPVRVNALQANAGRQKNSIITSRYNILTFVPMQLVELLNPRSNFANFYFLMVGFLQMVPDVSVTGAEFFGDIVAATVWQTLIVILVFHMFINAKEEINRHRSDRRTNSQRVAILQEGDAQFTTTTWACVKVGAVVKVYGREYFPADLVLLRGSDSTSMGQCWANTKPLDGETDTKLRLAPKVAVELLRSLTDEDVRVQDEVQPVLPQHGVSEASPAPHHAQSGPLLSLGGAPARPLCLPSARLAALGSSALPK